MRNRLFRALFAAGMLLVGSFAAYFAIQSIAYRSHYFGYLGINLLFLSLVAAAAIAIFGAAAVQRLVSDPYERRLIAILSAIAFVGYTNVYNIVFPISLERSFSVRILVNLANAQNGALSKDDLEKIQTKEAIYGLRYREMVGAGLIRIGDDRNISLTAKGKAIAGAYIVLGDLLGYSGGFDCAAMQKCDNLR